MDDAGGPPRVSVVVPVRNEAPNVAPLLAEIEAALAGHAPFEIVYVDDGSSDGTAAELARLRATRPHLRALSHAASCGQSAAVRTGVRAARGATVITLDGDGQNDPAFMPAFLAALAAAGPSCGLVQGTRVGRKDTPFKRWQSRVANAVRSRILRDGTRDTGCGFKCFPREVYLALPYFDALHRFMPALVRREGFGVAYVDVVDRPRLAGVSNYGFFDRLWVGIVDLMGVRWLLNRRRRASPGLGALAMMIDLWRTVGGYFYDVFVNRLDWWAWVGIFAQALFTGRFVVQWIASERAGRSVVPFSFWILSIGGGLMLLVYAIYRRDPVFILGQGFGCLIYFRNLSFVLRERRGALTPSA